MVTQRPFSSVAVTFSLEPSGSMTVTWASAAPPASSQGLNVQVEAVPLELPGIRRGQGIAFCGALVTNERRGRGVGVGIVDGPDLGLKLGSRAKDLNLGARAADGVGMPRADAEADRSIGLKP